MGRTRKCHATDVVTERKDFEGLETDDFPVEADASQLGKMGEALRTGAAGHHRVLQTLFRLIIVALALYGAFRLLS